MLLEQKIIYNIRSFLNTEKNFMYQKNNLLLMVYFYLNSFFTLFEPFIYGRRDFLLRNGILLIVLIYAMKIRKTFNIKFIVISLFLFVSLTINTFLGFEMNYIAFLSARIFLRTLIPLVIFSTEKYDFKALLVTWYKFATILTSLLPIYLIIDQWFHVNYFSIGYLAHLNALIIFYTIASEKKLKFFPISLLLFNIVMCIIFGSRMVTLGLFTAIIIVFLAIYWRWIVKNYILSLFGFISFGITFSLIPRFTFWLDELLRSRGIFSRNVRLIAYMLRTGNIHLSGRDEFQGLVWDYIYSTRAFFPGGVGMVRSLTDNQFPHAHNFFLEILLVFGIVLGGVALICFFFKLIIVLINSIKLNKERGFFLILIFLPFLIRSFVGTLFLVDYLFLTTLSIVIFNPKCATTEVQ